ncbi:bifunctional DNA-formamidopyrimidine glycosylase/DNA-(apurinic or apyrimidinic site) lyase [Mycoplasma todarodis]|uniref:DNA-formamidopyrimidine glycosylase n=1 Tax=Mycoplasma todarodis TaxID=1937191 RepID=A0A4R0XMB8_9MOLU|nr:bifunctional DNA-formamidopyrimidine glycosylase/DNA-(apurinic or apyrimidinic site) lyase [Mycoplasma todarodis]TCG10592.1 DNA-formamidopyrimidine glycosylase [Mycoplasma todarodis]
MPEMPEVRTMVKGLNPLVSNKVIESVDFIVPKMLKEITESEFNKEVIGKTIKVVENIGKWIVFKLSEETIILSHLRMTGTYYFYNNKPNEISKHAGIIFKFTDGTELHFNDSRKFGTMHLRYLSNYLEMKPLDKLAKEPQDLEPEEFHKSLNKTSRAIKTVVLDQHHVIGFGNIYVDETLWEARIHPETPASKITLKEAKDILKIGASIMDHATKLGGSSIRTYGSVNGKPGEFQKFLKVFDRAGQECLRCKTTLQKSRVNGRGTVTCAKCQIKK